MINISYINVRSSGGSGDSKSFIDDFKFKKLTNAPIGGPGPSNNPPTALDKTVMTLPDTDYTFSESDFSYSDADGDLMNHIEITNINKPAGSSLQLSGVDVNNGDTISTAQIPNLVFTPAAGEDGANYATYDFRVHDGTEYSTLTYTMTIDVICLPWPMYHHDIRNTGFKNGIGDISIPSMKWSSNVGGICMSSPALGDVDKDGIVEIVIGSDDKNVYCFDGFNGNVEWTYTTGDFVCSAPAIGDVDNDGNLEIIVYSSDTYIYCLEGDTGNKKWDFDVGSSWQAHSSPVIDDVDDDGNKEIIVGTGDDIVYCLNGNDGLKKWDFTTGDPIHSSPAVADVDNDGAKEVIIGSNDNYLYCLNGATGIKKWDYKANNTIAHCSPAIGDVDSDGDLEIIFSDVDHMVYCLEGDGIKKWDYTASYYQVTASPAIGNVDSDPDIEVIGSSADGMTSDGDVFCLNGNNGNEEWTYDVGIENTASAPALGDIDNDGDTEIIYGSLDSNFYCLDGNNGNKEWEYTVSSGTTSSPAIGDVDNDGELELIVASNLGDVYCLDSSSNNPPTQPTVDVTPDFPSESDDLLCTITIASTDPDGDPITYTYVWDEDGTIIQSNSKPGLTDTLDSSKTSDGSTYTCTVTPNDGIDDGPSDSDSVTLLSGGLDNGPWPRFHQNNNNTGLSPHDTSHVDGTVKWTYTTAGSVQSSPSIGSDGRIYVGSIDTNPVSYTHLTLPTN